MKFKTLTLIAILFITSSWAGNETQNGGGLSESYLATALVSLPEIYDSCIAGECNLEPEELELIGETQAELKTCNFSEMLDFDSEKAHPGFFKIDGEVRIAKTGSTPCSVIIVNRDLLYRENQGQSEQAIDFATATGILTHELGHHHPKKGGKARSHASLDVLGAKIAQFVTSDRQVLSYSKDRDQRIEVITNSILHSDNLSIYVADSFGMTSIKNEIPPEPKCPLGEASAFRTFSNLHWVRNESENSVGPPYYLRNFQANFDFVCMTPFSLNTYLSPIGRYQLKVGLLLISNIGSNFRLKFDSVKTAKWINCDGDDAAECN